MNNLFKTILIYEALAFVLWNIMMRTQSDYEMWLFDNIHTTIYTILASILLIATIVYVAQTVGHKIKAPKILQQDPRKPGGGDI
tara:strand:+ start:965 stop:1216 length:252 start_codon:yes stop_codon:yes gene_type:complete